MADSFQPDSFVPDSQDQEQAVAPAPKQAATGGDSFQPDSFKPDTTPHTPQPEKSTNTQIDEIAAKHDVDPAELRSISPYYGAKPEPSSLGESLETGAKGTAGFAGRSIGMGIPQFAYKKLQDPKMRAAIDEVEELGNKETSIPERAAEVLTGPASFLGKGAGTALKVGEAATQGGIYGLTGSKEGEELKGAATGAALGTGVGLTGELVGKLLNKYKPSAVDKSLITRQEQFDIQKGVEDIASKTRNSEDLIESLGFGKLDSVTPDEARMILNQQLGEPAVNKLLNPSTEEGSLIRKQLTREGEGVSEDSIKSKLVNDMVESRTKDFAEDLLGKRPESYDQAYDQIKELMSRQGNEAILNRYKQFVEMNQAEKFIEQNGLRAINEPGFFSKAGNFVSDNQYVLRGIDEKYGTRTEDVLRDLNKDFNRSTFAQTKFRSEVENAFQNARKLGTDESIVNSDKIYNALDTGSTKGLTAEEVKSAEDFKKYFSDVREFVNEKVVEKDPRIAPLSIPARENYVPKMLKSTPELVTILEKKQQEALSAIEESLGRKVPDLAQLRGDDYNVALKNPAVKDLVSAVEVFDNRPVKDGVDLSRRLKEMLYSREGNISLETQARAALERTGEIPDFMLEKNLYKLARKYADNTIKHLYLRNSIDALRYQSKALDKAGADVESKYVSNIVRDLMGIRKGTAAEAMMQSKIKASRTLDKMIDVYGKDSVRGGLLTGVKAMPDMLQALTRQIYPNVLGYFNIRAVLQNATQSITKTAPELGTKYGYATLLRAAANTVGNFSKLSEKAKLMGNVPDQFIKAGEQAISEGIARSSAYNIPAKALDGMGKAGMILFSKMEEVNRALTVSVADIMARDLARGSKYAQESLQNFPRSIRRAIEEQPQATSEIIAKYLNDTTQYNYNRASMSEFGRVMGPFFSTFSKWPTATAGDMIQEFRNKGAFKGSARVAEKYIAPFLLLQGFDYLMGERIGDKDSLSDRQKKLFGSNGLSQSAPIGSIGGIMKGEIFTPPAVDAFIQTVVQPILNGDESKLERGAGSTVMNFTPTAGLFRLIFDDAVTYATGDRPEGSSGLERVVEGTRRIK